MKEAKKIKSGINPAIKIRTVAQISAPAEIAAAVPISGASAHIEKETLFGLVVPLSVSRIYAPDPITLKIALNTTSQWGQESSGIWLG